MIPFLLIALLGLGDDPVTDPDEAKSADSSVLVRYDLRPVLPRFDRESGWQQALVPRLAKPYEDLPERDLSNFFEDAAPDVVLDIVTEILGEELVQEGRSITLDREKTMLVHAPAETQAKVIEVLQALEAVLSSSVQLRLDVLTHSDGAGLAAPGQSVVSSAEAQRLVESLAARGAAHREHTFQLFAGRTSGVDQVQRASFLFDYDVEIAQGSFIYDPIVMPISDGLRMLVRGVSVPGGLELAVAVTNHAVLGDIERQPLNLRGAVGSEKEGGLDVVEGPQESQTVKLLTRAVAFNTLLPDDQAIVVACEAHVAGRNESQVLVLRKLSGELESFSSHTISGTSRTLLMINTELLSAPSFSISGGPYMHPEFKGHPWLIASLDAEPSAFLFDWMKYRYSVWRKLGPWILVVTDPAWDSQQNELQELVGKVRSTSDLLEVKVDLVTQDADAAHPVAWSLPILAGSSLGAALGLTGTAVFDYDVEVAQFSAVPDPVMMSTFDGLSIALEISRGRASGGGSWILDARGTGQIFRGPMQAFTPAAALSGRLQQPRYDSLRIDERVTVPRAGGASVRIGPRLGSSGPSGLGLEIRLGDT